MTAVRRAHSHVQYCVCIVMRTGLALSLLCNVFAVSTAAKSSYRNPTGSVMVVRREKQTERPVSLAGLFSYHWGRCFKISRHQLKNKNLLKKNKKQKKERLLI